MTWTRRGADDMGFAVWHAVDYSRAEIDRHLQGRFRKYKEHMLAPAGTCGVGPVIVQIEPK